MDLSDCKDFRLADIAGVNDQLDALQRRQRFGPDQAVGIGDQADPCPRLIAICFLRTP